MTMDRPASPIELSPEQEQRAQRLHRESLIFFAHDHCIEEAEIRRMSAGGVTAKQLHLSVDVRIWGTPELFRSSARELEALDGRFADPTVSDGSLKSALIAFDYVDGIVRRSGGAITVALEPADILAAKERGRIALVLGAEGARLTEYRLELLRALARLGLRHLQLTWAVENPIGATQNDASGRGLSPLGRDFVAELNRLGLIVDVSHLSYRSILDAVEASSAPVLNGHSGALALNPTQPQLLPDEVIQEMAKKGGVVAVHFMSQVVKPGRDKARFGHLMAQFEYLARLVGTEHIACGPDFLSAPARVASNQGISEPFTFTEGVEDVTAMINVTRGLVASGFSDKDVARMMGGNLLRLFTAARTGADATWIGAPRAVSETGALTGGITPL
jgi:membrane dipeptidase